MLSDETGYFRSYESIRLDDTLLVTRIGYRARTISASDFSTTSLIYLTPLTVELKPIEVTGRRLHRAGALIAPLVEHRKSVSMQNHDHRLMLSRIPGLTIKRYGGAAGISTMSVDGGPGSHTQVLINGIDLTSAQNGATDLSQLPRSLVASMRFTPVNAEQIAAQGSDGAVHLETAMGQNQLSISQGSWGRRSINIGLHHSFKSMQMSVSAGHFEDSGTYKVRWNQEETNRQNNAMDQNYASLRVRAAIRPDLFLKGFYLSSAQKRGVAGLIWSPDTVSRREDELQVLGSSLVWLRQHGHSTMQVSHRQSTDRYNNPKLNLDSDHKLRTQQIMLNDHREINTWLLFQSQYKFVQDQVQSSALTPIRRRSMFMALSPTLKLPFGLSVRPAFNQHFSKGLYDQQVYDLQISWAPPLQMIDFVSLERGAVYRYPSFNDLYWEPGGNAGLLPEFSDVTTAQLKVHLGSSSLLYQWQLKESENLILWMPLHSYWQAQNIQSTTRESHKLVGELDLPGQVGLYANAAWLDAQDLVLDRKLRYAPPRSSAAGIGWSPGELEFQLQYQFVDERIAMYDYPEDVILEAYELWDFTLAYTWTLPFGRLSSTINMENLLGTHYESIRGYPEPGRMIELGIRFAL